MKRTLSLFAFALALLTAARAHAQFAAVWMGAPPNQNCGGPSLGLDKLTPQLYLCGLNAQGVYVWQVVSGGGGGGGFANPMTALADMIVGAAGGAPARLPGPTSPNGVPQTILEVPSGGLTTAQYWSAAGVVPRLAGCPSNADTILATDRVGLVLWNDSSTCTANLAQAGSSGFASNFAFVGCNQGAGQVNVTPAASTISYLNGASYVPAAASMPVATGRCGFVYSDNTNYYGFLTGSGGNFPSGAQIGDTIRWNVNGDSGWDAANAGQVFQMVSSVIGGGTNFGYSGPAGTNGLASQDTGGGILGVAPTATSGAGSTLYSSSSASTNTLVGVKSGDNGSQSILPLLAFYRFSLKFAAFAGYSTHVRYWLGMGTWVTGSGNGNNAAGIFGTTAYATDSPNKNTIAFRYSYSTDTHWQAVICTGGGSQTTVDTGVTPDSNPHLFEIAANSTGTSFVFLIDNVVVATISTNVPTLDLGGTMFWTGDNKNAAVQVAGTFYYMNLSLR